METSTLIIAAIIGWVVFYYIIKGAVKWGTIEAKQHFEAQGMKQTIEKNKDAPETSALRELQKKYDKGHLTFDEYKKQWDKFLA